MLNLAAFVLVLSLGWVLAGSAGAALGLLWWHTPSFTSVWSMKAVLFRASPPGSSTCWITPWLMVRRPFRSQSTAPALEMICRDEVDAVEFARLRREWLGRAD